MDAKPQRLRPLRMRDENAPLQDVGPSKTLHQRNKSTPALSTLLQPQGGVRLAPKRTAFADVSNVTAARVANYLAKDDSNIPKKPALEQLPLKPTTTSLKENVPPTDTNKPAPSLLRPAQRPLSAVVPAKISLTNALSTIVSQPLAVTRPASDETAKEVAKPMKPLTRKQTTIFNDFAKQAPVQQQLIPNLHPVSQVRDTASAVIEAPPAAVKDEVDTTSVPPTTLPVPPSAPIASLMPAVDSLIEVPAQVSYDVPNLEQIIQASSDFHELVPVEAAVGAYIPYGPELPANFELVHDLLQPVPEVANVSDENAKIQAFIPTSAEPEEYWDEDDEEEYYDADGYTTARSIRSRGDTTGGVTTVMEPRVTVRVEKELAAAKSFVDATKSPEDVEDEAWDTSMVAEYGDEIFDYMRELERRMKPNPYYMDSQTEIQWSMRAVLMDWLVQVHHRFTLLPETLFLSVNYVDRFLSCKVVSLGKLQLVGATAIFVAAKYEEINCPSVQEIIYMVDGGYTMDEILKAERFMLTMLQFELGWPGPMSFLRRISKADDYDLETRTLAKYFLEVTVMDERFVGCAPSFAAAGAHCLARLMLRKGDWSLAHVHYSQYPYHQLRPLVQTILECCEDPRKHHSAVFDKYSDKRYKRASLYVETEMQRGFQLPPASRESNGYSQSIRRK